MKPQPIPIEQLSQFTKTIQSAQRALISAFDQFDENDDDRAVLGNLYFAQQRYQAAQNLYSEILSEHPNDFATLLKSAMTLHKLGQAAAAVTIYQQVLNHPENLEIPLNLTLEQICGLWSSLNSQILVSGHHRMQGIENLILEGKGYLLTETQQTAANVAKTKDTKSDTSKQ